MAAEVSFEALLSQLGGEEGPWQRKLLARSALASLLMGMHSLATVVQAAVPRHWCTPPPELVPHGVTADTFVPTQVGLDGVPQRYPCRSFNLSVSSGGRLVNGSGLAACTQFEFDLTLYGRTAAVEWQLVCQRAPLVAVVQSSFMLAVLVGFLVSGVMSDRFGRRAVIRWCALLTPLVSFAVATAPTLEAFLVLRAILGMLLPGTFGSLMVFCLEIVGPAARGAYGILYQVPFELGLAVTAMAALGTRTWWHLQLALSVPALLLPPLLWTLPESPRWLLNRGRLHETAQVLDQMATGNGRPPPERRRLLRLLVACEQTEQVPLLGRKPGRRRCCCCAAADTDVIKLVASPRMRAISLSCFWCLFVSGLALYGISEDAPELGGDAYAALLLSGGVGLLATPLSIALSSMFGRRTTVVATQLATAAPSLALLAVPAHSRWARLVFAMLARLAVAIGQKVQNVYSTELFPTALRSTGFGVGATFTRLGGVVAPLVVAEAGHRYWGAPTAVFGLLALVAAAVALILPETRGRRLPDTLEEVESEW